MEDTIVDFCSTFVCELSDKRVAEAALGDDHLRGLRFVFDLLAEVSDLELHLVFFADLVGGP